MLRHAVGFHREEARGEAGAERRERCRALEAVPQRFLQHEHHGRRGHVAVAAQKLDPNTPLVSHPGGTRVLEAIETALNKPQGSMTNERTILRGYGNMSAPTVMFVLEEALRHGLKGPAALSALGPGFTASFLAMEANSVAQHAPARTVPEPADA